MKHLLCLFICIVLSFEAVPQDADIESYEQIDSQIKRYDQSGNNFRAIIHAKEGLSESRKFKNLNKEGYYHLRLAKFYYNSGNTKSSLMHFRLYAVIREQEVSNLKNTEMLLLENAYLEQLTFLSEELDLNSKLIDRIQSENITYEESLRWIYTAAKIGIGAMVLIFGLLYYNSRVKKQKNKQGNDSENQEIERLRSMTQMQEEEQQRNQEEIQLLKGKHQRQAWYTRQLQHSLLPDLEKSEFLKNGFFLQLSQSSSNGDFYIVQKFDKKMVIAVLDCPGHGPDAVFNTVTAYHHLQAIFQGGISTPSMILTLLDQKIKHSLEDTGLDKNEIHGSKIAVCEINLETKEVEYAGAGFPLFYVHLDDVHIEKGNQFPVGDTVFSDSYYSSVHIRLSDGDMIYFFTDGYYRQLGGKKNKKFMRSSLSNLLKSMHKQTLTQQKFILEKVLMEWKGKNMLTDDVLVVGLKV